MIELNLLTYALLIKRKKRKNENVNKNKKIMKIYENSINTFNKTMKKLKK